MSHLPEYGNDDLQSRIDTIRQQNQPRERIPTERELDRAIGKPGERAICAQCGKPIINTGLGFWDHVGINKPRHIAMPKDEMLIEPERKPLPSGAGVWVGDAPAEEDDWPDSGSIIVGKDIKQVPNPPASVADLYRVLSEQLTPVQQTMLKAFWLLMAEDSRMLDWLSERFERTSEKISLLTLMDIGEKRTLREAIRERMSPKAPDEFERNPEMPFSLKDAGKA